MTNTGLAIKAKAGERWAISDLWERVEGLCYFYAKRYFPMCDWAGIEEQDLRQECFFGFLRALDAFDPDGEWYFSTYLRHHIHNVCAEALGIRNGKQMCVPVSLQDPLEDDGGELQDLIPDPDAQQPFEDAEEQLYTEQLHKTLDDLLHEIPERRAAAVRARYFDGTTQIETAAALGVSNSRVGQLERQGLRDLKQAAARTHRLDQYREFIISNRAYRGTGYQAWKHGGSVQEKTVLELEWRGVL